MKSFTTSLPSETNVKGSGTGSPASDMNKVSNALVEVRSSVPNTPADIGAITAAQLTSLSTRVAALIPRLNALKIPAYADSFNRTSIGGAYSITAPENLSIVNNQLALANGNASFYSLNSAKTTQMYGKATVLVGASVTHPSVFINFSVNQAAATSHYRGHYSVANGRWELYKRVSGQSTLVATKDEAAPTGSYVLIISQFQNLIALEVNGSGIKCSYNDATPLTGKQAGLAFTWSATVDNAVRVDDFIFGDI